MLDMVQSMMEFANLPIFFWRYALETACYILNKISSKSVDKTPYEIWIDIGRYSHTFRFGDVQVMSSI